MWGHLESSSHVRSYLAAATSTYSIPVSNGFSASMSSEPFLRGAAAGITYGVVERLFASAVPWLLKPSYVYQPPNRAAVVTLLLLYALAGAILQGSLALAFRGMKQQVVDVALRLV